MKPERYKTSKPTKAGGACVTGFDSDNNVVVVRSCFLHENGDCQINDEIFFERECSLKMRAYVSTNGNITARAYGEGTMKSLQMVRWVFCKQGAPDPFASDIKAVTPRSALLRLRSSLMTLVSIKYIDCTVFIQPLEVVVFAVGRDF